VLRRSGAPDVSRGPRALIRPTVRPDQGRYPL